MGWMPFLAYVPVPAVEAEAIVTYANNYLHYFIKRHSSGLLTVVGFITCTLLLGVLSLLNLLAVRKLLSVNSTVTWWKIAVPVLTIIVLISASTHWDVWAADPNSYRYDGIFTALPAAGIVFSFLGFRTAIDLGGESSNFGRHILAWFGGMWVLSALGDVGGGYKVLSFWTGVVALAAWSLIAMALPAEETAGSWCSWRRPFEGSLQTGAP